MKNLLFKLKTKISAFVGKCKQILSDKVNLIALSFLGIIAIADLFGAIIMLDVSSGQNAKYL